MKKFSIKNFLTLILSISLVFSFANIYFAYKYPLKYGDLIEIECNANELNYDFVCGVIAIESRFNKNAVSSAGAIGLMQLMSSTAESIAVSELGIENFEEIMLFEPSINLAIGVKYLKYLFNKFTNVQTVLGAYNAGETVVSQWLTNSEYSKDGIMLNNTPYRETNFYIDAVMNAFKIYRNKQNRN